MHNATVAASVKSSKPDVGFLLRGPKVVPSEKVVRHTFTSSGFSGIDKVSCRDTSILVITRIRTLTVGQLADLCEKFSAQEAEVCTSQKGLRIVFLF